MSLPDHIKDYREHEWSVYELPLTDAQPEISGDDRILWCNSDSQMAEQLADSVSRLYVDLELLSADRDPSAGGQVGRLKATWGGHAEGTLAIVSFEKIGEQKLVYLIEA
jgi:hypothetical protein